MNRRINAGDYDVVYQPLSDEWHVVPAGAPLRAVDGDHNFLGWFMTSDRDLEWWPNHGQPEVPEADREKLSAVVRSHRHSPT